MAHLTYRGLMNETNSASGAFMAGQRTVIDRTMFDRLVDALLSKNEDERIKAAVALAEAAPSWWSGPTSHRDRLRTKAGE